MIRRIKGSIVVLLVMGSAVLAQSGSTVDKLFSNHMVLQRDRSVPVWGTAQPGAKITVKFGPQAKTAETDKNGKWLVRLDALKMSTEPAELIVVATDGTVIAKITDVLVGDVYLCAGQSNMQWTLGQVKGAADIAADFPKIRYSRDGNGWKVCTRTSVNSFTAVGFYFGRKLHQETGIPVGLLNNAIDGTRIEPWIAPEGIKAVPEIKVIAETQEKTYQKNLEAKLPEFESWVKAARAALDTKIEIPDMPAMPSDERIFSGLYTRFTLPLVPYAIRGMIWYQGESNGGDGDIYIHKMNALITGLRKVWNQGEFPLYFVQLANYMGDNNNPAGGEGYAAIRMAQLKSLSLPNTGMAVTIDIGEGGNIHPKNKFDVGERLALWALARDYGRQDLVYSGPLYKGMKVEGNKIRISFDHVGKGLMVGAKNGKAPTREVPGGKLKRFAIAGLGADGKTLKWVWGDAVIDNETVVVSSPEIQQPVAVRYAYSANPEGCNLYNKDGLPASPFCADKNN